MLKTILNSIGFGGARVDTVLDDAEVEVGSTLSGEVRLTGGSSDAEFRGIALELVTRCIVETRGDNKVYAEIVLASATLAPGALRAGEARSLPFRIAVPAGAPLTIGSTSTVLRTRLDVAGAIDPRDSDRVRLCPTPAMVAVLQGMERAGFRLAETEVEHNARRANPFVQEFDFRPLTRRDWGVEEVEIAFSPLRGGVEVSLTVDNRGGFFLAGRERTARFRIMESDLGRLDMAAELRRAIASLR